MVQKKIFILPAFFFLLFGFTFCQENKISAVENNLTESRDIIFEDSVVPKYNLLDRMKFYKVPSVSMAIIHNGKIEWAKAYGYADTETKKFANSTTLYQAASLSKSVNALGIMKLVQAGRLSLEKDIRSYLASWVFPDNEYSKGKTITIKNLLSHTAGLSTSGFSGYSKTDSIPTINQILNGERPSSNEAVKPVLVPGTAVRYSGGGTTVIRKILDDNISANYDSLMQELILKPLKMTNSTFSQPLSDAIKNYACAYDKDMQVLPGNYRLHPEQAPDGLWTTATDFAKFIIAIQQSLHGNKDAILKPNDVAEMLTPVINNSDAALGTFIRNENGEKYFMHIGANYGYRSAYYGSFTGDNGVVIFTNSDNGQALINEIVNSVAIVYKWKGIYDPVVKKLVTVPDTLITKYVGDYYSEDPQIKISIIKKSDGLELIARRPEKMFATGFNTFFLAS
ncbi:MAG: beta-lactamase family protein, partial [Bacteroidetes bacterium]|nr:beta-lactamase family protein [Bacteroidota bacterium]